jgi:hypothetical protein
LIGKKEIDPRRSAITKYKIQACQKLPPMHPQKLHQNWNTPSKGGTIFKTIYLGSRLGKMRTKEKDPTLTKRDPRRIL